MSDLTKNDLPKKNGGALSTLSIVGAMAIFGTIGIFRRFIPIGSGLLAMIRGIVGALGILVFMYAAKHRPHWNIIGRNAWGLILTGACIGFNWILLFEAYRFTTVAIATLCNYMAPVFVMAISPILLKEKLETKRILCILAAFIGMVLVTGVLGEKKAGSDIRGILLGLASAVLYAAAVLGNKQIAARPKAEGLTGYDRTLIQVFVAGAVLIPYVLIRKEVDLSLWNAKVAIMVLIVCLIHTGLAYCLYFGAMDALSAQRIALLSYLDPILAVILSMIILREPMNLAEAIGAVIVLGATIVSELPLDGQQSGKQ